MRTPKAKAHNCQRPFLGALRASGEIKPEAGKSCCGGEENFLCDVYTKLKIAHVRLRDVCTFCRGCEQSSTEAPLPRLDPSGSFLGRLISCLAYAKQVLQDHSDMISL